MNFPDEIWGIDLVFIQSLKKYNENYAYILVAIDFFSRWELCNDHEYFLARVLAIL